MSVTMTKIIYTVATLAFLVHAASGMLRVALDTFVNIGDKFPALKFFLTNESSNMATSIECAALCQVSVLELSVSLHKCAQRPH